MIFIKRKKKHIRDNIGLRAHKVLKAMTVIMILILSHHLLGAEQNMPLKIITNHMLEQLKLQQSQNQKIPENLKSQEYIIILKIGRKSTRRNLKN